jgi:hypothetical protein
VVRPFEHIAPLPLPAVLTASSSALHVASLSRRRIRLVGQTSHAVMLFDVDGEPVEWPASGVG